MHWVNVKAYSPVESDDTESIVRPEPPLSPKQTFSSVLRRWGTALSIIFWVACAWVIFTRLQAHGGFLFHPSHDPAVAPVPAFPDPVPFTLDIHGFDGIDTSHSFAYCQPNVSLSGSISHNISTSSPHILLYNRGPINGVLEFIRASDLSANRIEVNITFGETFGQNVPSPNVTLCSLARQDESWGLAICAGSFSSETPCLPEREVADDGQHHPNPEAIVARVTIRIPSGVSHLKSLSTVLNGFSVTSSGGAFTNITAENIKVMSSDSPIDILGLNSANIHLETSNAPINGAFIANHTLYLATVNGGINATAELWNNPNTNSSTTAEMFAINGDIISTLNLRAPGLTTANKAAPNGTFIVKSTASHGNLSHVIDQLPLGSILQLEATAAGGAASVTLPPQYEGRFELLIPPHRQYALDVNENAEDPRGEGRKRAVKLKKGQSAAIVEGDVKWEKQGEEGTGGKVAEGVKADSSLPAKGTRSEAASVPDKSSKSGSPTPDASKASKASEKTGVAVAVARSWVKIVTTEGDSTLVLS
ncbi:hypothetical protein BOTBODRAFT_180081 [Botryobasidium botryosum FD-172 SS1]|uniref:Uncharacterized protein n=1 Tax=Botryobasidium botryosum (strain FD-172 SS1) TaxID=930990 RepID=A0A067LXQ8_BOTB1|nr:hypothetical protein BOTBODRAFT_180081 [Botryobasidium botryosum FD-172 SS1]